MMLLLGSAAPLALGLRVSSWPRRRTSILSKMWPSALQWFAALVVESVRSGAVQQLHAAFAVAMVLVAGRSQCIMLAHVVWEAVPSGGTTD